jgi:hypothetical protein
MPYSGTPSPFEGGRRDILIMIVESVILPGFRR